MIGLKSGKKQAVHEEFKRVSKGQGLFGKWENTDSTHILKGNRVNKFLTIRCDRPDELTLLSSSDQKDQPMETWFLDGKERINNSSPVKETNSAVLVTPHIVEETTQLKGKRYVIEWILAPDANLLAMLSPSDIDTDYPPTIDKATVWVYNRVQEFPKKP